MSFRRLWVIGVGLMYGGLLGTIAHAQAQAMPAMASPPQQMRVNEAPAYPSTDSATSYPSTTTPAASAFAAPTAYPSTYPSTNAPAANAAASQPSSGALPGITSPRVVDARGSQAAYDTGDAYVPYTPFDPTEVGDSQASIGAGNGYVERQLVGNEPWTWQILPNGLMYKSYLAGNRESRLGSQFIHERTIGWRWDATLGARVGLLRYGTDNDFWPQGWQLDVEGAAFPRLDLDHLRDMDCVDFRAGIPLTTRQGPWEFKFGYYHYCSHIGDEYILRYPAFERVNYVRESLVLGTAVYLNPSLRLYSEAGCAFYVDGGAKPWEFQFGADLSPPEPTGARGAPFFAVNGHLREECDFGGSVTIQTGWQWRGTSGHLLRVGMQYFNGLSDQAQFYRTFEEQIGIGLWYDF